MVAEAARKGCYRDLRVDDITRHLRGLTDGAYPLVVAADVFVYLGALDTVLAEIARSLAPNGLLAFTAQASEGEAVRVGPDLRYAHSADYLRDALRGAGLSVLLVEPASTRREKGLDVPGLVVVAFKPDRSSGLTSLGSFMPRCG